MKLKYKKIILLITMSTMGIGLLTLSIGISTNKQSVKTELVENQGTVKDNETKETGTNVAQAPEVTDDVDSLKTADDSADANQPNEANTLADSGETLKRDAYPKINELVKNYYDARVACDMEAFKTLMNDTSSIDLKKLQNEAEYIKEYKNIECYTLPGPEENSYIVYVYQEYKIAEIETLAPGMERFYVRTDEKGAPYIYIGAVENNVKQAIDQTAENEEVKNLITGVEKKLQEAMSKDSQLYSFRTNLEKEATETTNTADGSTSTNNGNAE